jgi:tetraacyldisaccharide 4'-kinase
MAVRRWCYRRGVFRSYQASPGPGTAGGALPVISVGNLTAGGTGKTPMVVWIVRQLQSCGLRPAVVMRGYKSTHGQSDEALLLGQLTGATIIVNPDRVAGAAQAALALADVIVLDDGFQHRRLRRDLDIVLVDASDPFGLGHCLPRGLLREPPSALADAQVILITRSNSIAPEKLAMLKEHLAKFAPQAVIAEAIHRPSAVIDPAGETLPPSALAGRRFFAFCGIGNPESFFSTLGHLGIRIAGQQRLDDHCRYDPQLLAELCEQARQAGCDYLITTQKDFVKINLDDMTLPLWQLSIEMEVRENNDAPGFLPQLLARIAKDRANK